ncbi:MAG: hypothetical protein AB9842_09890 [Bacteroidales bacterium]
MKIKVLLPLFLFFILHGIAFNVHSQNIPKSFSTDPGIFVSDLGKYFESVYDKDQRKAGKKLIEKFNEAWLGGAFNAVQQEKIMKMANSMLKYKMRPMPHYSSYLESLLSFYTTIPSESSFNAWFNILEKSLDVRTNRKFLSFLDISVSLFADNVLYESNATKWKSSNDNYQFEYDSVPCVVFPSLDLTGYANKDSTVIFNTGGIYYPTQFLWVGQGGKVNWKRTGLPEDQVWAELDQYTIGLRFSKYEADSVKFYNLEYFDKPMLGYLEEKVLAAMAEDQTSYPRFTSYFGRLRINDLFRDVDYEGGFSMHGPRLIGSGNQLQDALLFFKKDGKEFITVASKSYVIRKDRISSTKASITVRWEEDSIYHPGLEMKYIDKTRELSLIRSDEGIAMSPYYNSYHQIDMYCEAVYWKMDEPKIDFTMIKGTGSEGSATFESSNYFRESRYLKLQGIDEQNPLDQVAAYGNKFKTREFTLTEYFNYIHRPPEQVKATLLRLAIRGFLIYDLDDDKIIIKDRLYENLNARAKKTDYDVIQFNSTILAQPNATLSLLNFDLKLRGVPMVYLSDSQKVYIYPTNQELILKKNRDFLFSGRVHAGLFDFFAHDCSFDYDKFKLNLPVVDSLSFMVKAWEKNQYGERPLVRVKSVICNLSGDILIDHPNNKSGVSSYPEYPIFNSKNDAYVYYDRYPIQKGVYKRDIFFFHVYPFSISKLVDFETDEIKFEGYLVSGGIFPDIEEPLRVQPDYSLGFVKSTPPGGLAVYGGIGNFENIMDLSHKGFKGNGTMKYLVSTSESNDFNFYPDSVNADLQQFRLEEQTGGIEYPLVTATDVYEHWLPYRDLLFLSTRQKPIEMYAGQTRLTGTLALTPSALTGEGTVAVADAEMDAELFKFKNKVFDSDTADFRLRSYDLKQLAFSTHNYKSHIDFTERKGEFKSNGGGSKVDFPINQYICFMDEFEWYMDKEEIALANTQTTAIPTADQGNIRELVDIDISGSEFVSVHPKQDSLRFLSPKARYNLRNNIIYAEQVSFIRVADAAVFPEKGLVTIFKEAKMKTLNNAKILANTTTKYHTVDSATVDIFSRKDFTGQGVYAYVDDKETSQRIFFSKINVDSNFQTNAFAHISDSVQFTLNQHFDFAGDVRLFASKEFLNFKGGYRLKHDCDTMVRAWVRFESEINPREIYLPVNEDLRDINNKNIFASLAFSQKNNHIYSAILNKKENFSDQELVSARGFIYYDENSQEYQVGSIDKIKTPLLPGNYLSLNTANCVLRGEGPVNMGTVFGQVKLQSFGAVDYFIVPDSASFDLVATLDFYFADDGLKMIRESLKEANLMAADLSKDKYKRALGEIMGVKDADDVITEISLYGTIRKIPSELNHTLVFSDVMFKWNPNTNSFVSMGPIGIGNMEKVQINKYVKGYIEITKKRSGDILDMYLEISENEWYYFNYSRNLMQAISSSDEFNKIITELKPEKRTHKGEKGEDTYRFNISTAKKKKDFIRRMEGVTE